MKKIILILLMFIFLTRPVFAGGGRIELRVLDTYGDVAGKRVRVEAKISKPDSSLPSVGEKAEFRLVNPRTGDFCTTFNTTADSSGYIRGECGSNQVGTLTMYVHSFDANEDTYKVSFQIVAAPLPTVTPTRVPTPTQTRIPTPTATPRPPTPTPRPPTPTPSFMPTPTLVPTAIPSPTIFKLDRGSADDATNNKRQPPVKLAWTNYVSLPLVVLGLAGGLGLAIYAWQLKQNLLRSKFKPSPQIVKTEPMMTETNLTNEEKKALAKVRQNIQKLQQTQHDS